MRPEDIAIDKLIKRDPQGGIDEVVLASNVTLKGQPTAHYIAEWLEKYPLRLSTA